MRQSERGFTIIEMMIAVMVFSVGLLALAGTASIIMTTLTTSQSRSIATSVAESRFERIGATPCASRVFSGSAVTRGITETWSVERLARADDVTVSVSYLSQHQPRSEQFRTFLPC
jgi:prepilin-type N-terminal cleavage/methylation domain-containing protein